MWSRFAWLAINSLVVAIVAPTVESQGQSEDPLATLTVPSGIVSPKCQVDDSARLVATFYIGTPLGDSRSLRVQADSNLQAISYGEVTRRMQAKGGEQFHLIGVSFRKGHAIRGSKAVQLLDVNATSFRNVSGSQLSKSELDRATTIARWLLQRCPSRP